MTKFENVGLFVREKVWLKVFSSQTFSRINTPTFSNIVILHTYPPMKMEQSVPKRRHIKFRSRGITQKKHTTFGTRQKFEIKNSVFLVHKHHFMKKIENASTGLRVFLTSALDGSALSVPLSNAASPVPIE